MSHQHIDLTEPLIDYLRSVSEPEPDYLVELRAETASDPMARMQITPEQGLFLSTMTRLLGARRTLEVGVFTGYSSLAVARALPDNGQLIACDISEHWTAMARRYWRKAGLAHKIQLHLRPAIETLDELIADGQSGTFDFAFIDADKTNYLTYYERALTLTHDRGLIAIDNVLWHARVIDPNNHDEDTIAIRAFNEHLRDDSRVHVCMLPFGDGLTLVVKR
jgi:caffeoyl-CoA O-methyltransferase